jgi:hypothetical protein
LLLFPPLSLFAMSASSRTACNDGSAHCLTGRRPDLTHHPQRVPAPQILRPLWSNPAAGRVSQVALRGGTKVDRVCKRLKLSASSATERVQAGRGKYSLIRLSSLDRGRTSAAPSPAARAIASSSTCGPKAITRTDGLV